MAEFTSLFSNLTLFVITFSGPGDQSLPEHVISNQTWLLVVHTASPPSVPQSLIHMVNPRLTISTPLCLLFLPSSPADLPMLKIQSKYPLFHEAFPDDKQSSDQCNLSSTTW